MRTKSSNKAFTLVEVAVTIVVVALIAGTSMTILDNLVGAMLDIRMHTDAFEIARQNMETLLSLQNVQDKVEFGVSEIHPEIQWQTAIEPFYEPVTNAMWVRAVCSASYTDSKGKFQEIELEHWLTNLPADVVRQIIQQRKAEEEYLDLLAGTASGQAEAELQESTMAYLEEAGLDVDAYASFLDRQRRSKLDYIARNGFDDGYADFLEQLREDENRFLQQLGMNIDEYNRFAVAYVPRPGGSGRPGRRDGTTPESGTAPGSDRPNQDSSPADNAETPIVYTAQMLRDLGIPEDMIPWLLPLLNGQ